MNSNELHHLQEQASLAYGRVAQSEAAAWAQAVALFEVAAQLQQVNEHLEQIATTLSTIQHHGLTVENVP